MTRTYRVKTKGHFYYTSTQTGQYLGLMREPLPANSSCHKHASPIVKGLKEQLGLSAIIAPFPNDANCKCCENNEPT